MIASIKSRCSGCGGTFVGFSTLCPGCVARARRDAIVARAIRVGDDGSLVRASGRFFGKPIAAERFVVTIAGVQFRFDRERVRTFLKTGHWPRLPARKKGGGYCSPAANRAADDRLLMLMRERPEAGVRALAQVLGLSHPAVSRRIARLKTLGLVARVDGAWVIEEPVKLFAPPWVRPISSYGRPVLKLVAGDDAREDVDDAACVGRLDGEAHALDAADRQRLGAEAASELVVRALSDQM
jgi:hypothetical protein